MGFEPTFSGTTKSPFIVSFNQHGAFPINWFFDVSKPWTFYQYKYESVKLADKLLSKKL